MGYLRPPYRHSICKMSAYASNRAGPGQYSSKLGFGLLLQAPKKGHPPGFETQVPGRMASDMANHKASGRSEAGRRELSTRAAQVLYQPGAARRR